MNCVNNSFEKGSKTEELWQRDNTILREQAAQWKEYGSLFYPAIVINSVTFRGDMNPINVVEAICASMWAQPKFCMDFYIEEKIDVPLTSHNTALTAERLLGIVIGVAVLNFGMFMAYRRCMK